MSIEIPKMTKFLALFRPGLFDQLMRTHVSRATQQNAAFAVAAIRKKIQNGKDFERNADLTIALKGEDKPLVGRGTAELFKSITLKKIDPYEAFVGVLRTDDGFNVAATVHDGVAIKVTEKMRGMFFYLWLASEGRISPDKLTGRAAELFAIQQVWFPLSKETTTIVIPSRPFVDVALADPALRRRMEDNWKRSMGFVFRDMKRRFLSG